MPKGWFLGDSGERFGENQTALLCNLATWSILCNGVLKEWGKAADSPSGKTTASQNLRLENVGCPWGWGVAVKGSCGGLLRPGHAGECWRSRASHGAAQPGGMLAMMEFPKFQCSTPAGQHGIDTGSPCSPRTCGYQSG